MIRKILRQNLKYIIVVLLIWSICIPIIVFNRDDILVWYSHLVSKEDYDRDLMRKFVRQGDSVLDDSNVNLELMRKACDYYKNLNHIDPILYEPKWLSKKEDWQDKPNEKDKAWWKSLFSSSTDPNKPVPVLKYSVPPRKYWKKHINTVLEALDYYKRALNYSGPYFEPVKKIEEVSWAACRPREIIIAYSTFILNTEEIVEKEIQKRNEFFLEDSELIKTYRIVSAIKKGTIEGVRRDHYEQSLEGLLFGLKWEQLSPFEAEKLYGKLLIITSHQKKIYNNFRKKRGELRYQLGSKDKEFYYKAIEDFHAAREYANLNEFKRNESVAILNSIFASDLWIAKTYLQLEDIQGASTALQLAESDIDRIQSEGGILELGLREQYDNLRQNVYRKKGKLDKADQIR